MTSFAIIVVVCEVYVSECGLCDRKKITDAFGSRFQMLYIFAVQQ